MTHDTNAAPRPRRQRPPQRSKIVEELNALGIDARELKGVMSWQMRAWAVIYCILGAVVAVGAVWGFLYTWLAGRNFFGGLVLLTCVGTLAGLLIYSGLKTWKIFGRMN